ncbi:MAG: hypothetical protein ACI8RA_002768, partial [Chlamydiales bacterium]
RFQLLSTPPHGDAVTFSCKIATFLEEDSHLSYRIPSQAHCRTYRRSIFILRLVLAFRSPLARSRQGYWYIELSALMKASPIQKSYDNSTTLIRGWIILSTYNPELRSARKLAILARGYIHKPTSWERAQKYV